MIDWKLVEKVYLFVLVSFFNVEIYVVFFEDVLGREVLDLYFLICGSYLYIFEFFLVFKSSKESLFFKINFKEECFCC